MRPRVRLLASTAIAAAALAVAAPSRADEAATAEALFREGRRAMTRGDWADAVARLRESQRLEPAPGTLLNLAIAEEKVGRLAAAWEHARAAADQLPPSDDRQKLARDLHEALDKRLPRLVLRPTAASDRAGVRLDGVALGAASFGVPLPMDPGRHEVVVRAPGHLDRVVSVELGEGATVEQRVEPGARVSSDAATRDGGAVASSSSRWRTVGFVGLGVGAAALAAGGVTGYMAMRKNETVEAHCDARGCDATGVDAAGSGRDLATVSTISTVAGAALVVGGALVVWLARGRPAPAAAALTF